MSKSRPKIISSAGYSKLGCRECKKAHLKCDETLPICNRCLKKNIKCEYPNNFAKNISSKNGGIFLTTRIKIKKKNKEPVASTTSSSSGSNSILLLNNIQNNNNKINIDDLLLKFNIDIKKLFSSSDIQLSNILNFEDNSFNIQNKDNKKIKININIIDILTGNINIENIIKKLNNIDDYNKNHNDFLNLCLLIYLINKTNNGSLLFNYNESIKFKIINDIINKYEKSSMFQECIIYYTSFIIRDYYYNRNFKIDKIKIWDQNIKISSLNKLILKIQDYFKIGFNDKNKIINLILIFFLIADNTNNDKILRKIFIKINELFKLIEEDTEMMNIESEYEEIYLIFKKIFFDINIKYILISEKGSIIQKNDYDKMSETYLKKKHSDIKMNEINYNIIEFDILIVELCNEIRENTNNIINENFYKTIYEKFETLETEIRMNLNIIENDIEKDFKIKRINLNKILTIKIYIKKLILNDNNSDKMMIMNEIIDNCIINNCIKDKLIDEYLPLSVIMMICLQESKYDKFEKTLNVMKMKNNMNNIEILIMNSIKRYESEIVNNTKSRRRNVLIDYNDDND